MKKCEFLSVLDQHIHLENVCMRMYAIFLSVCIIKSNDNTLFNIIQKNTSIWQTELKATSK